MKEKIIIEYTPREARLEREVARLKREIFLLRHCDSCGGRVKIVRTCKVCGRKR